MTVRVSKNRVALENMPLNLARSTSLAAATVVNLATATGNLVHITGSLGPITSFGVAPAGSMFVLIFDASPTITYNATTMILNTGTSNYTCAPGDRALALSEGSGSWVVTILKRNGSMVAVGSAPLTVAASRSLTADDDGKTLSITAVGDVTLTVPAGLPSGFGCAIYQSTSGAAVFTGSGATIVPATSGHTKTGGVGKMVAIVQVGTNTYSLNGGTA